MGARLGGPLTALLLSCFACTPATIPLGGNCTPGGLLGDDLPIDATRTACTLSFEYAGKTAAYLCPLLTTNSASSVCTPIGNAPTATVQGEQEAVDDVYWSVSDGRPIVTYLGLSADEADGGYACTVTITCGQVSASADTKLCVAED